jgi:hypothetical protein
MRRHKAVARIFLLISIATFMFAGLAQTLTTDEMRVDLVTGAEGVAEALPEWRGRPSTAGHLHSRFDMAAAQSFNYRDDPNDNKFFNKELNRKLKEYFVLGSIAGLFTGVANGIQKQIFGTVSPGAYVFLPSPPSPSCQCLDDVGHKPILTCIYLSQTVGRSVEPLIEHPQDQEDPVSRSLSNVTDGHLQMLSFFSRRMLNNLD